ncbi:MAG TPA: tetratricopeptide repeat protein [Candidatus Krumholzibacteria bacterium]|nr:tetratricopeptide repeat protein [Candidatus Krumholzibacteria bacterium]
MSYETSRMTALLDRIEHALDRIDRALAEGPRWPWLLFLFAFVLKAAYVVQTNDALFVRVPIMDARYYDGMAQDIARGNVVRGEAFFMGPLYPYFLALVYAIVGRDFTWVRLLQATGGALTVVLVFLIGRRLFRPSAALAGALLLALNGAMTFYETELMMEWMGALLNCTALYLLLRARPSSPWAYAGAGAALGLSALARASILVFAAVALAWLWWPVRDRARVRAALAFAAALVLALTPAVIHNLAASRDFVLVTSNAGINFYIGNNRDANGTFVPIPGVDEIDDVTTSEYVERATGRSPTPSEVSHYWFDRAMRDVREDPARTLALLGRKIALFFNGYEVPQIESFDVHLRETPWLRVLFVRAWFVIPFAILGMVIAGKRSRLLRAYVLTYAATIAIFFVTGRYRSQVVPILSLFAGVALIALPALARDRRALAAASIGWAALFIVTNPSIFRLDENMLMFREYVHRGRRLSETRSFAPAIREVDRAIAIYPKQAEGYVQRAIVYKESGDDFKAIEDYNRALDIDSTDSSVHYDLAQSLRRVNLKREAVREYDLAIRYDPNMLQAYNNLGVTLRELGLMEQAAVVFRKATEIAPSYAKAFNNLGALYAEMGRPEDAVAVFEETTRRFPTYANAYKNLAMAYAQQRRARPALAAMRRYVELEPEDIEAREVVRKLEIAAAADSS